MKSDYVDVKKLKEGMVVRNYKEMCTLLGESIEAGNSRKAQLKKWQRYFNYEKDGHKFIITEIYPEPLEKEAKRGNRAIYVDYIELLLMNYLSKKEGYTHTFTTNELYFNLAFINNNYLEYKKYGSRIKVLEDLKNTPVTHFDISKFDARVYLKFKSILFSALKSMRSRRLLEFEEQYYISKNKDGDEVHEVATDEEIEQILAVEKCVLSMMGFSKINNVYLAFKGKEFKEKVSEILLEKYNWNYAYKKYKVIFLGEEIKNTIPIAEVNLQKKILNSKIIDAVDREAETQYKNNQKKIKDAFNKFLEDNDMWGTVCTLEDFKKQTDLFVYDENYVKAQKCLSEYFLKIK